MKIENITMDVFARFRFSIEHLQRKIGFVTDLGLGFTIQRHLNQRRVKGGASVPRQPTKSLLA